MKNFYQFLGLTGISFLLLTACQPKIVDPLKMTPRWAAHDIHGTQTLTPFLPLPATSTWTPTVTPQPTTTPSLAPTPSITPSPIYSETLLPTNTPIPWYQNSQLTSQLKSILLLGSDHRPGQGFRTDIIILVLINPETQTVSMISFPRDLYVVIPGWGYNRINVAQSLGGFDLLATTFEQNFGIRPQYFALVDFNGFVKAVDSLNGINVHVSKSIQDHCDVEFYSQDGYCSFEPGWHEMNGTAALWYVRSRYSSSGIERTQRAQEVLQALLNRVVGSGGIEHLQELYEIYSESVTTNLTYQDILILTPLASQMADSEQIKHYTIGTGLVWDYIVPENGAWVLLPNLSAIRDLIKQAAFSN